MTVNYRPAKEEDLNQIVRLNYELLQFEQAQSGGELFELWMDSEKHISKEWSELFKNEYFGKVFNIFVAVDGTEIIGYVMVTILHYPRIKPVFRGSISGLYVRNSHRRRKIGEKLMELVYDFLLKNKVLRVELEVITGNKTAEDFYKKSGFKVKGTGYYKNI